MNKKGKKINFSKISIGGGGAFVKVEVDSDELKKEYKNYSRKIPDQNGTYPSHENYPSPWAAAEYFARILAKANGEGEDLEKRTLQLLESYLKGVFIGVLQLEDLEIDVKNEKILRPLKNLFPYTPDTSKKKETECNPNPIENGKIKVLKYGDKVVALEFYRSIFFPSAEFSYWPEPPQDEEKDMLDYIESEFNKLSDDLRIFFYSFLANLLRNGEGGVAPWMSAIAQIIKNSDCDTQELLRFFDQYENKDDFDSQKMCLQVSLDSVKHFEFLVYNPFALHEEKPSEGEPSVSFKGGSIEIKIKKKNGEEVSYKIEGGCKGRDGKFYILEETAKKDLNITKPGGLEIKLVGTGKKKIGGDHWTKGLEYKDAKLIVKIGKKELGSVDVRVIKDQDVFVKNIVKVNDKYYPDSALRYVFRRGEFNGEKVGFEDKRVGETYSILGGKVWKKYEKPRKLKLNFAIWPQKIYDGWKPYFIYRDFFGDDFKIKLLDDENKPKILEKFVNKVDKQYLKNKEFVIIDKNEEEYGIFSLNIEEKTVKKQKDKTGVIGVDFGTTASVVAYKENKDDEKTEAKVLKLGVEPLVLFGDKNEISLLHLPINPYEEVSSLIYLHDTEVENPFLGFEEASIINYKDLGETTTSLNLKNLRSNLKWGGSKEEQELYLYLLIMMTMAKIYEDGHERIELYFSYPLSFDHIQREGFKSVIDETVNTIKEETGIEFGFYFVPETDVLRTLGDVGVNLAHKLIVDMGGGSMDIVYFGEDGDQPVYVDSIAVAGEKVVTNLAKIIKRDEVEISRKIIKNEKIKTKAKEKDEIIKYVSKFLDMIIGYLRRQILGKLESEDFQYPLEACARVPEGHIKEVILLGNGWKLLGFVNKNFVFGTRQIKGEVLSTEDSFSEISSGGRIEIKNWKNPKTWLAFQLANHIPRTKFASEDLTQGPTVNPVLGIDCKIKGKEYSWTEKIPLYVDIGPREYPFIPENEKALKQLKCIHKDLELDKCNAELTRIGEFYGMWRKGKTENAIIKSLLAFLIERFT